MDATVAILLTALVNIIITGLISGVAVYRIQRKIENSFAEKLERFKSDLAYSTFEQQTKFARLHEKRVQSLEALYEKYKIFIDASNRWIEVIDRHMMGNALLLNQTIDIDQHLKIQREVQAKLNDCLNHFETNRLLFSVDLVNEIWHIFFEAGNAHSLIVMALDPAELPSSLEAWSNYRIKIEKFYNQLSDQAEKVENIYRSVADNKG
jgi:hypothetical protein